MAAPNVTQYELLSVTILSSTGIDRDVKFIVEDLNIYQDIYSSVISGEVILKDANNILSELSLCGNEYLYIKFQTLDYVPFEKYFRIYKISDVKFRNATSLSYKIQFCSEEFILNQQTRISKSYKNQKTSDIVYDIVTKYLGVDSKKFIADVNYEETINNQNIIIPNEKPFEAINWVSSFSINSNLSSAYTFFETQSGFKFKSLQKMVETRGYTTLYISPQNIVSEESSRLDNKFIINNLEITQMFDLLSTMANGGYSSKMLNLDLTHGKASVLSFNPVNNNIKKLNNYLPFNEAVNRNGVNLINDSSYVRYFPNFQGSLVDKWLLQRAAQFALLNNTRMNVMIYGDSQIEAGMVVGVDFPNIVQLNNSQESSRDNYKSGNYLVTSVRHRIYENRFTTYLELCKDSNISAIPSPQSTESYNTAKRS